MNKPLINAYLLHLETLGRSPRTLAAYRERLLSFQRFLATARPRPQLPQLNLE